MISVEKLKVPMVPYFEIGVSCFSVMELKDPNLEMGGSNNFLFRN